LKDKEKLLVEKEMRHQKDTVMIQTLKSDKQQAINEKQ